MVCIGGGLSFFIKKQNRLLPITKNFKQPTSNADQREDNMEELQLKVKQTAGKIEFNFQEIRDALAVQMSAYADAVVTEDTIQAYKGELATLRKIYKAVDDKRKDIKREFNKPLDEFEEQVKGLLEEINKPINLINSQLTLFEEDRIAHKRERVSKMYEEIVGEYLRFLPLESNYNPKWDNKSYSDSDIQYDISEKLLKVKTDLNAIKGLNSEIEEDVINAYIANGNDLAKAIARNTQYVQDKAKVVEQVKTEVESKVETSKTSPLEGSTLNEMLKMTKTVKLIISYDDLQKAKNCLDFADVKYQVVEGA